VRNDASRFCGLNARRAHTNKYDDASLEFSKIKNFCRAKRQLKTALLAAAHL
jgi:hypothetical protein